ncbi:YciI family protein [Roseateles cellulosilyticus]|uniref:YciI family protein n=1 Tax=Pelomonas cellulosilytica TaxID=2906762 RepID=A0ABS8Y028_9BURK|nr:YciI family protein [Pelomonas sp. P8]MCE4556236.1 YciI family protein [Pelomonas sp. P8]
MPTNDYLVLSRGQWDDDARPQDVQAAIDAFYVWYERGLAEGRLKPGSRLEPGARVVGKGLVSDGPFAETKEWIGGFWFIVAETLEQAAAIAAGNPCLQYGLTLEIRQLDGSRADVSVRSNETPPAWRR